MCKVILQRCKSVCHVGRTVNRAVSLVEQKELRLESKMRSDCKAPSLDFSLQAMKNHQNILCSGGTYSVCLMNQRGKDQRGFCKIQSRDMRTRSEGISLEEQEHRVRQYCWPFQNFQEDLAPQIWLKFSDYTKSQLFAQLFESPLKFLHMLCGFRC